MADLQLNLTQYRAQLSQVEAALTTDPENEELQKLKKDLEEVINLTLDLLKVNEKGPPKELSPSTTWKVGDRCEAVWSRDGNYYPATIDLISDDCTTCTVTFDYGNTEIVKLNSVRDTSQAAAGQKRSNPNSDGDDTSSGSGKKISRKEKDQLREQKRKKMAKKQQRLKELGEQREQEKNRWLDFFNNSKSGGGSSSKQGKNLKGVSKKSIFASPETLTGRVGVGTCGIGDKPMTNFPKQDKVVYKK